MANITIANPQATDLAISLAVEPATKGVCCGSGCCNIPSDWQTRIANGVAVPGCTYPFIAADGSMLVNGTVQTRLGDSTYTSGLNAQDVADFQYRLLKQDVCLAGDSQVLGDQDGGTNNNGFRPAAAASFDPRHLHAFVGLTNSGVAPTNHHRGLGGATIVTHQTDVTNYGTALGQVNPLIMFMLIGINDCNTQSGADNFQTNFESWATAFHAKCPNCVLVLVKTMHWYADATVEARRATIMAQMPTIKSDLEALGIKCVLLDLSEALTFPGDYNTPPDGHPNATGYAKLAPLVAGALASAVALL